MLTIGTGCRLRLQKQGEGSQETMLGAGCFKSGPLSVRVSIPRRGFAVGQSIPFSVDIENNSRKKLNVRMALIQVHRLHIPRSLVEQTAVGCFVNKTVAVHIPRGSVRCKRITCLSQ